MPALLDRMTEDMRVRDLAPRTPHAYLGAVTRLATFCRRPVDSLATMTEAEFRPFLVALVDRHTSRSTLVYRSGIRFLVEPTLGHRWPLFDLLRSATRHTLPVMLSPAEVRTVLGAARDARIRMGLTLIDSCGLRLAEGVG
ncbi:MAG: phage integrase N-terminal SAM-like domain-containing protein [Gemmatimonadaceae bacterium]